MAKLTTYDKLTIEELISQLEEERPEHEVLTFILRGFATFILEPNSELFLSKIQSSTLTSIEAELVKRVYFYCSHNSQSVRWFAQTFAEEWAKILIDAFVLKDDSLYAGQGLIKFFDKLITYFIEQGEWHLALSLSEDCLQLWRKRDELVPRANAIHLIGWIHHLMDNYDEARLRYRDALRLFESSNDKAGIAKSKLGLGQIMMQQGQLAEAVELFHEAKAMNQANGAKAKMDKDIDDMLQAIEQVQEKQGV